MSKSRFLLGTCLGFCLLLFGCAPPEVAVVTETAVPIETISPTRTATQEPTLSASATPVVLPSPQLVELPTKTPLPTPPPTATAVPTVTPVPTDTPAPTATITPTLPILVAPTLTPVGYATCVQRDPATDDLLALVTKTYGLSAGYVPDGLVPLSEYFTNKITLGYPTLIREVAAEPPTRLVADMEAVGLEPFVISGYRDYNTQKVAFQKWQILEPERAAQLSAPPGHSEHQLGTTVDFGSPVLQDYVEAELDSQFHTNFYLTPEGIWLIDNAHRYGFTLSYPREAAELTGFYYEPWHYRYVGVDLASRLYETKLSLTEYQLVTFSPPCEPVVNDG